MITMIIMIIMIIVITMIITIILIVVNGDERVGCVAGGSSNMNRL